MPWLYSCAHSQEGRQPEYGDYVPSLPPRRSQDNMKSMMSRAKAYVPPPNGIPER